MICDSYNKLTPVERVQMIGKCVHLLMESENCFGIVEEMISIADKEGKFTNVKILPEYEEDGTGDK